LSVYEAAIETTKAISLHPRTYKTAENRTVMIQLAVFWFRGNAPASRRRSVNSSPVSRRPYGIRKAPKPTRTQKDEPSLEPGRSAEETHEEVAIEGEGGDGEKPRFCDLEEPVPVVSVRRA